ncbi:hypothetical protein [Porphyrobacter sp. ULC335]|uniref:hypothetical protein n=1 Tax=Porphyrobacter sp. ULC335 TaxID=2854260 RepID=UPI002220C1C2|nr:hypothetical protein [Porphyrobacter sp. ULC335]UYV15152.1 hypothetical protein KVF90_13615 [Porphyrobacter sp. ULC335]
MEDNLNREEAAELLNDLRPEWHYALSNTSPERFLKGVWSLHMMQSSDGDGSQIKMFNAPEEARSSDFAGKYRVRPWELETILNEFFEHKTKGLYHFFRPEIWNDWAYLITLLRRIENSEAALYGGPESIIDHLFHIGSKQFEWQEGFANYSEIFRGLYIYGQGACASAFSEKFGISVDEFFSYGFALLSVFMKSPVCNAEIDVSLLGISDQKAKIARDIITGNTSEITELCRRERSAAGEIAFKPSAFRLYPCVRDGFQGRYLFCPLPELILKRVSTGIFYDVIDAGPVVREDYGRRFESYVALLLRTYQPLLNFISETTYMTRQGEVRTPDLFLFGTTDGYEVAVECKASRLPYKTRFTDIRDLGPRPYDEMIKAVFQIWRHAYSSRSGRGVPKLAPDAVGLVLTLDNWFQAGIERQQMVLASAKAMFFSRFPHALQEDMIPIGFTSMTEMEHILRSGTPSSILQSVKELSRSERRGWSLDSIHREIMPNHIGWTDFPFVDELAKIVPFWTSFMEVAREKANK